MTILTYPALSRAPSDCTWRLRSLTQTHTSPFDGSTQTLTQPGARWEATISYATLGEADRRTLDAFIARLGGRAGRFTFSPAVYAPRRATGSGTPLINGASQTGAVMDIDGWSASAVAFRAGDFFSYADTTGRQRLHMVTADVTATAGGVTDDVPIAPPIRRAGANNAAINVTAPVGVFMLAEDAVDIRTRPPLLGSVTFSIIEALV